MTDETEPRDDEFADVLAELRRAGEADTLSADAVAAIKASFIWRTIDDELAELTYDSAEDRPELAGVRGAGDAARLLTFESPALTVEVEASAAGPRRRLLGQLVPPQPGEVEVRHAGGSVTVAADEVGRFTVDDVPPGPVSLRCRGTAPDAPAITTDWVLV